VEDLFEVKICVQSLYRENHHGFGALVIFDDVGLSRPWSGRSTGDIDEAYRGMFRGGTLALAKCPDRQVKEKVSLKRTKEKNAWYHIYIYVYYLGYGGIL